MTTRANYTYFEQWIKNDNPYTTKVDTHVKKVNMILSYNARRKKRKKFELQPFQKHSN